jgi:hypothetical protein
LFADGGDDSESSSNDAGCSSDPDGLTVDTEVPAPYQVAGDDEIFEAMEVENPNEGDSQEFPIGLEEEFYSDDDGQSDGESEASDAEAPPATDAEGSGEYSDFDEKLEQHLQGNSGILVGEFLAEFVDWADSWGIREKAQDVLLRRFSDKVRHVVYPLFKFIFAAPASNGCARVDADTSAG